MRVNSVQNRQYATKNQAPSFGINIEPLADALLTSCKCKTNNNARKLLTELSDGIIGAHEMGKGNSGESYVMWFKHPNLKKGQQVLMSWGGLIPTGLKQEQAVSLFFRNLEAIIPGLKKKEQQTAIRLAAKKAFAISPEGLQKSRTKAIIFAKNAELRARTAQSEADKAKNALAQTEERNAVLSLLLDQTDVSGLRALG